MLELLDRLGVDRVVTFFYQDIEVAGHRGFVGEVLRWGGGVVAVQGRRWPDGDGVVELPVADSPLFRSN